MRQNKASLLIASLVIIGLLLAGASKFYTADKTKQVGKITEQAASTSKGAEEIKPPEILKPLETSSAASPKTLTYVVKEGDYVEKIVADVCGAAGGWVDTRLRNKDRILVGQTLSVVCR